MKLISVALHGYKRFEERSSMNVDGKLVAVVGPNESGKSSFLQALMHLNHANPIESGGVAGETTRNVDIPASQRVIEATFLVDEDDKKALSNVHGYSKLRWCKVYKLAQDQGLYYAFTPHPKRSLQPRRTVAKALLNASSRAGFLKLVEERAELDLPAKVENLLSALDTSENTLPNEAREEVRSLADTLAGAVSDSSPKYLHDVVQKLLGLYEHEKGNPAQQAMDILHQRRPKFLFFSEEERQLQSEYNLAEVWEAPPAALSNLAQLANLDLEALHEAVTANDYAEVESITVRANEHLRRKFYEAWSQSDVTVRLRTDEQILKVLVQEETIGEASARFTSIAERSDGLRQFVALVAFSALRPSEQVPILLLDEVETHLHYDAQADLVQMLAKQNIVTKIIYTTHSIGCLPEDLGTGVRFIRSNEPESFTSRIENAFWTSDSSGFSPLLFGMGASTLAFVSLRKAVITEGPSDMILWPTLLREASGRTHLDFQVVPGLSKENGPGIIVLDRQAPRTVYLLDSDSGGKNLHRELKRVGILDDRIFHIPDKLGHGLVIEDLIDPTLYVRAVNEELHRSVGESHSFPQSRLPKQGRPTEVEAWCKKAGISPPKKTAVAYRVLEEGINHPVLAEDYRKPIGQLFDALSAALHS